MRDDGANGLKLLPLLITFIMILSIFMFAPSVSARGGGLSLDIVSPQAETSFTRGSEVSLSVLVRQSNGDPFSAANVTASLPGGTDSLTLPLSQQPGLYSNTYAIKWSDPTGPWTISYQATDESGYRGSASVTVNITASTVIVQQLATSDPSGQVRSSFYNDEKIAFSIYSGYPDGTLVTSGAASIQLMDPNGELVITLAAVYVPASSRYVTLTEYAFSASSQLGMWSAVVPQGGLDDGYGNRGPVNPLIVHFQLSAAPTAYGNSDNSIPNFAEAGLVPAALISLGAVIPVVALKNRRKSREDDTDRLMNLARRSGFTLIEGDKQTGKSTLTYRAIENHAAHSEACILLTFEIPPTELMARMTRLSIDAESLREKKLLRIIDCSNVSESINLKFIRSKLVKSLDAKVPVKAIFIDSLNLLFDDLDEDEVKGFLTGLIDEMKGRGGQLWATITYNGFSQALLSNIEDSAGLVLKAEKTTSNRARRSILRIMKTSQENGPLTCKRFSIRLTPESPTTLESL